MCNFRLELIIVSLCWCVQYWVVYTHWEWLIVFCLPRVCVHRATANISRYRILHRALIRVYQLLFATNICCIPGKNIWCPYISKDVLSTHIVALCSVKYDIWNSILSAAKPKMWYRDIYDRKRALPKINLHKHNEYFLLLDICLTARHKAAAGIRCRCWRMQIAFIKGIKRRHKCNIP